MINRLIELRPGLGAHTVTTFANVSLFLITFLVEFLLKYNFYKQKTNKNEQNNQKLKRQIASN